MKYIFLFICFLFSSLTYSPLNAQYVQGKEDLIAPSPTVAAMVKYGQIPVSYNTGIPSISIPLYTLKCGDLALPISLEYHAGGIRVNDVASWVGLGWSLNAGGVINIAVQGRDDAYPRNIIPIDDFKGTEVSSGTIDSETSTSYDLRTLQDFRDGADTQPDIYNYQIGSNAGQFIADLSDNNLKTYNVNGSKDMQFTMDYLPSRQISAKDQFGSNYYFNNQLEEAYNNSQYYQYNFAQNTFSQQLSQIYQSTTHPATSLTKVINANKTDSITFGYSLMYENYNTQMSGSICWGMSSSRTGWTQYVNPFYPGITYATKQYPDHYSKAERIILTRKVSTITGSDGSKIVFTTGATRKDLNSSDAPRNSKPLDKIEIYDPNNNLLKRWEFIYDYFTSYITNTDDGATNYRLKLTGLKEYGSDLKNPQTYTFNYYGDINGEPRLPYRNSFSGQDYWGFCNKLVTTDDAKNFKKAFPNITDQTLNQIYGRYYMNGINESTLGYQSVSYSEGEDKTPNENFISACSLKQIIYPTGGNTTFEYESNKYNYSYLAQHPQPDYIDEDITQTNELGGGQRIKKITSNPVSGTSVVKEYQYIDSNSNTTGEITNCPKPARQKVWQESGHTPAICDSEKKYYKSACEQSYLELKSDCNSSLYTSIGSALTYSAVTEISDKGKTVYNFYKRNDQNESGDVTFYEKYDNIWGVAPYPFGIVIRTDKLEPMDTQYFKGSLPNPMLLYSYMSRNDTQTEDDGFWGTYYKHGTLKNKEIFNKNNQLVFIESYGYKDINQKKITGLRVYEEPYIFAQSSAINCGYNLEPACFYNTYCFLVGLCQLTGKTATQYDVNGNNPVVTKEEYTYNDDNLLVQTKMTNSSNEVITKNNRYPSDINIGVYSTMKQRNMLNYPIEITQKKNNSVVGSTLNTYQQVNNASNFSMFLLQKVYQAELTSGTASFTLFNGTTMDSNYKTPYLEFLTYNKHGKICEIRDRKGITTSYLWGYNYQYPVAKIEGIALDEVKTAIGEQLINNLASNASPSRSDIDQIRTNINNSGKVAMVSTFTYAPLIGMTTATDPRGVSSNYSYDTFNRLYLARNDDKNIVAKYRYGYQNNPDNGQGGYDNLNASISTNAPTYIINKSGIASINVSSGSGDYTCTWTLNNETKSVLSSGTGSSISFSCPQTGTLTLSCMVTDNKTGNFQTISKAISCYPEVSAKIVRSYEGGAIDTPYHASIDVTQGSGNYSYSWSAKNSSGTSLALSNTATSEIEFTMEQTGSYFIECVVADNQTGSYYTASTSLICYSKLSTVLSAPSVSYVNQTNSGYITATGGSFSYLYGWSLLNENNTVVGQGSNLSEPGFMFTPNQTGTFRLNSFVTDKVTGYSATDTKQLTCSVSPPTLTLSLESTWNGWNATATIPNNGSGIVYFYSYNWTLTNDDTGEIIDDVTTSSNVYGFICSQAGSYTLWCGVSNQYDDWIETTCSVVCH